MNTNTCPTCGGRARRRFETGRTPTYCSEGCRRVAQRLRDAERELEQPEAWPGPKEWRRMKVQRLQDQIAAMREARKAGVA